MNVILRLAAGGLILYSYFEISNSLPRTLPLVPQGTARIGVSAAAWVSLAVEILVTGLLLIVPWIGRVFPETVHFGWRGLGEYTPRQRRRLMPLLSRMVAMLSISFNLFSGLHIHRRLQAAVMNPRPRPADLWWVAGVLVSFALITWYYVERFDEEAGAG